MTVIREVSISNFRGIYSLKWCPNPGINCLIGPGDGGKSTILDAIELTLGTRQSIAFTDADFHRCEIDKPIVIDVTLGALPDDLRNLEAYGHFLRGWNPQTGTIYNETSAALETVLTVRLIVRDDLEPQWLLFSEGPSADGRERNLQWKHRQLIAPTRLGTVASHHMALGPRSVLGKLSPDKTQASAALAAASRQARQAFAEQGCDGVDEVLTTSKTIANNMGIPIEKVNALLDVKGVTFSGGAIALHDEDQVPLKNLGSGSMRLLVAGLQKVAGQSSISIIDEAEFGLEPYRIIRLLNSLGAKSNDNSQQVFLTTHSPVVLRELSSVQLHAVRATRITNPALINNGEVVQPETKTTSNLVFPLGGSEDAQKTLRACAEAFLAPNVIVCEGKTEIGVVRGLDLWRQSQGLKSILANGCYWADGGGSSMMDRAKIFARMGYRAALFMDSDVAHDGAVYADLAAQGITVFRWQDGYSTEAAIFSSVSAAQIPDLLSVACEWRSEDSIDGKIRRVSDGQYNLQLCRDNFTDEMRPMLGQCAGDGKWFKDIEPAERVLKEVIAPTWQGTGAIFTSPLASLWQWINTSSTAQPENAV
ncbi:AAA family ATPase [Octadecabacter sp. R77987]|uniref:AAA family ATPase n=1 Tax=Octadecabacter sp. R77987 TaxID=3093874 RepID=UPI00366DF51E